MNRASEKLPEFYLWQDESVKTAVNRPSITPMLCAGNEKRPAVLVIPGGGYGCVCESTEGSPIGMKFNELGFHAFILDLLINKLLPIHLTKASLLYFSF